VDENKRIACTVGIIAHNEAANIGRILKAVCEQALLAVDIAEIVVVASGCTDGTEQSAGEWARVDGRIRVLIQERREGKASGINFFLKNASYPVVVLSSADLLPEKTAIEALVAPFADPEIGMTSCRPVPLNESGNFMGFAAHLLWKLHHHINLNGFKAGEMTAFRKIFERIPYHTAVDEASVEPVVRGQGYRVQYVPAAVVYNKGPDTVEDFLRQRRRIYAGHLAVRETLGYAVSTMSGRKILGLLLGNLDWRPKQLFWTWAVVGLEVYGRFLGWRDYKAKRDHSVWEIAQTTKELKVN
jgi:cellulose synthase/poly-beta-1,6-N-acetylglucosamine synthase-like glycosyltransferase